MKETQDKFALVIVDMQNDFVLPGSPFCIAGAYETIPRIQEALEGFRKARWPVFHVVREHRPDGSDVEITRVRGFLDTATYAIPGTKGCEIVEANIRDIKNIGIHCASVSEFLKKALT